VVAQHKEQHAYNFVGKKTRRPSRNRSMASKFFKVWPLAAAVRLCGE
jgi:hypothetical protein